MMLHANKQLKITKLFRKGAVRKVSVTDECDELAEEVQQLEQQLQQKQTELFRMLRNNYRHKASPPKKKAETFSRPEKIVLTNSIESLKRKIEVMSKLTGIEVQSYMANDHCCVVFHMQHDAQYAVKHGLKIDMHTGRNEISGSSLPLGFNLNGVLEDFDNLMKPECLRAVRKALVAYYDRLEQYQTLKSLVNIEAELFKTLDSSHIEISVRVQSDLDEEQHRAVVVLDYRVYDIRPKTYTIRDSDLPEGVPEALKEQCAVFKKKPLSIAFKEAFIDGTGQYKLIQQIDMPHVRRPRKRFRPNKHHYNDDTFHPDDCSDQGEDDECGQD